MAENILTTFQFLEAALAKEAKKAIVFIDEVQEICRIEAAEEIQGAIRHFAQKSRYVTFIFSGSNRKVLRYMFNDNAMPLYQLCDTITLDKISEDTYRDYLNKVSKLTWKLAIPPKIIDEIIEICERHPRRMNNLCLYVWRLNELKQKAPTQNDIKIAWQKLITAEAKGIRHFLSKMNTSQLKVLAYITLCDKKELTSKGAIEITKLSSTAISKALHKLEEEGLIERTTSGLYQIIDPAVKDTIALYESEILDK